MSSFIDILHNVIKYNDNAITVIIDDENIPWFSGASVAKLLEYKNTNEAITNNTDRSERKLFDDLRRFINHIPIDAQPHAIYINEPGLYSLIFSSKMPKAKEFKHWVTSKVLPSIKNTGSFILESKHKKELKKINDKFKLVKNKVKILEHKKKMALDFEQEQKGGSNQIDFKEYYLESKQKFLFESILHESDSSDREFIAKFYEQSGGAKSKDDSEKDYEKKYHLMEQKNKILSAIVHKQKSIDNSETVQWLNSNE